MGSEAHPSSTHNSALLSPQARERRGPGWGTQQEECLCGLRLASRCRPLHLELVCGRPRAHRQPPGSCWLRGSADEGIPTMAREWCCTASVASLSSLPNAGPFSAERSLSFLCPIPAERSPRSPSHSGSARVPVPPVPYTLRAP